MMMDHGMDVNENERCLQALGHAREILVEQFPKLLIAKNLSPRDFQPFLHIWKPICLPAPSQGLPFLPCFHVIATANFNEEEKDFNIVFNLHSFHGKLLVSDVIRLSKMEECLFQQLRDMSDDTLHICQGVKNPDYFKNQPEVYTECLAENFCVRSKQCKFFVNVSPEERSRGELIHCIPCKEFKPSIEHLKTEIMEQEMDPEYFNGGWGEEQYYDNGEGDFEEEIPEKEVKPKKKPRKPRRKKIKTEDGGGSEENGDGDMSADAAVVKDDLEDEDKSSDDDDEDGGGGGRGRGRGRKTGGSGPKAPRTPKKRALKCKVCLMVYNTQEQIEECINWHRTVINLDRSVQCPQCNETLENRLMVTDHFFEKHPGENNACSECLSIHNVKALAAHVVIAHHGMDGNNPPPINPDSLKKTKTVCVEDEDGETMVKKEVVEDTLIASSKEEMLQVKKLKELKRVLNPMERAALMLEKRKIRAQKKVEAKRRQRQNDKQLGIVRYKQVNKKASEMERRPCPICLHTYTSPGMIQKCIQRHDESLNLDEPISCPMCIIPLESKRVLTQHFALHHANTGKTACCECLQIMPVDGDALRRHFIKNHHTAAKPEMCPQCGKSLPSARELKLHMEDHETGGAICPECGKHFSSKKQMVQHVGKNHRTRIVKCPHCEKQFDNRRQLRKHLPIHAAELKPAIPNFPAPADLQNAMQRFF